MDKVKSVVSKCRYKYLEDIEVNIHNTPYGWLENNNDNRIPKWKKDYKKYGFDSRETWSLDYTFVLWLYQRVKMYNDITNNIIDKNHHKFNYREKEYSQQEMINILLNKCEKYIKDDKEDLKNELVKEITDIWGIIILSMWW